MIEKLQDRQKILDELFELWKESKRLEFFPLLLSIKFVLDAKKKRKQCQK